MGRRTQSGRGRKSHSVGAGESGEGGGVGTGRTGGERRERAASAVRCNKRLAAGRDDQAAGARTRIGLFRFRGGGGLQRPLKKVFRSRVSRAV